MALAQLGTVRRQNHGHMAKFRRLPTKGTVYQQLLGSVGKMLFRTQHMSHTHQMVIHNYSKIIGRNAIGFHDNKIIKLVHAIGNITMNQIMEGDCSLGGVL